ncbi:hypothetical protein NDK47_24355 [Brevibacillus ruminantium]|uniref:Uncharacterized protein n=1 Tax=Brevibacillus ruminantium TaxID=2950604 RepID=A0ABY4WDG8_9BACL|nr:hypothetical protein [Brevibacillus ruminantium]USG65218.1 hypothetical protein NDK47_24355 [Brevibacillus ruminantium]
MVHWTTVEFVAEQPLLFERQATASRHIDKDKQLPADIVTIPAAVWSKNDDQSRERR